MAKRLTGFLFCALLCLLIASPPVICKTYLIKRGNDLQETLDYAADGDTVYVGQKIFEATPIDFIDSLCGNCTEHKTEVNASYGFMVKDKSLIIIGLDRKESILKTNAGYGLFFINSPKSIIANLTITGGRRDKDGNATDAAIVVRNSHVYIQDIDIIDNEHRIDSVIVGIGGIVGREGAEMNINDCNIINNGWDGIALYRGASAEITDCTIKKGRGAGIGVTWDATCLAYRNHISEYWKGIGAFGTSWVAARNNIVVDNLGWGIIATGQSYMDIANNVVYHNGNCGVAPWSTESRGRIINNIIVSNGWREEWVCPCVGVWNYGDWAKWEFAHNIVWNNESGNYKDIWDQTDINGNLSIDPLFVNDTSFILSPESPAHNNGHPSITDRDGSQSDMGIYGGPQGQKTPKINH